MCYLISEETRETRCKSNYAATHCVLVAQMMCVGFQVVVCVFFLASEKKKLAHDVKTVLKFQIATKYQ